jgi:hypothetical protein
MFFINFFDLNYNLITEYLTTRKEGRGGGQRKGCLNHSSKF